LIAYQLVENEMDGFKNYPETLKILQHLNLHFMTAIDIFFKAYRSFFA